jgi:foldase protein PrsA
MRQALICRWALAVAALTAFGLIGCGGAPSHQATPTQTARLPVDPAARPAPGGTNQAGAAVVVIGNSQITKSALDSRLLIEARSEAPNQRAAEAIVPVPPAFTDCIAKLARRAKTSSGSMPTRFKLLQSCRQLRQKLLRNVLGTLIADEWTIGEAAKLGLGPSDQEVRQRLEHLKATQFGAEAKFRTYLAETGENVPDILFNLKKQMASALLFQKIKGSVEKVSPTTVADYYIKNKTGYLIAEQRDLGLIRTKTAAAAARAMRELNAGASFASVAKRLKNQQPLYTVKGLLPGLQPHVYSEKALNYAIFTAKPHVLSGPIRLNLKPGVRFRNQADIENIDGYYVFEVFHIRPPRQQTLAQVKQSIEQKLPRILTQNATSAFVKRWRAEWIARTNCRPGYVVPKCRQFSPSTGEAEDAYTLN